MEDTKSNQSPSRLQLWLLSERDHSRCRCDGAAADSPESLAGALRTVAGDVSADAIEALERRILASAAEAPAEVHLPYLEKRDWAVREQILLRTLFTRHGSRLLPDSCASSEELNRYEARLAAAGAFEPGLGASLEYAGPGGTVRMPAGLCAAWRSAPDEKTAAYFHAHAPASIAVQQALRRTIPEFWLRNPANPARVPETCAILAYASSAPFRGRLRTEFTYDIMKPRWFLSAFHFASKPLGERLQALASNLSASGQTELAAVYAGLNPISVLTELRNRRRSLEVLVSAEEAMVNMILRCGVEIREAPNPRRVIRPIAQLLTSLENRLHKMVPGHVLTGLQNLLFIEATRALSAYLAPPEAPAEP